MTKVMEEVHLTTIKPKNEVLLLAQEISFAKVLASNDKRLRDRGLRRLKKWFTARSQGSTDFTKEDHMRIWKGLFYCMWMSDKPLVQEELAEEISNLIHSFATFKSSLLFVETFFESLGVEWFGIDQLRLDKFMMLVRRFMRQSFELVARIGWPKDEVQQLSDVYYRTLNTAPLGLNMHITEVFCEELAKVGKGELSSEIILLFITMFARFLANLKDGRVISQITRRVFLHLIRQTEMGVEHEMKFAAWKEYGFPGGDIDAAERVEPESDEEEEMMEGSEDEMVEERQVGVDARAGNVDVLLPPLDFDPLELLEVLKELRNKKETTVKARKALIQLILKYEKLSAGKYPLGIHKVALPNKIDKKKELMKAAKKLYLEERKLIHSESESEEDGNAQKSLAKKQKREKSKKCKKSVWKVSEANDNEEHIESEPNNSWEVIESDVKVKHLKKRKSDEEESFTNGIVKSKTKKAKLSQFSVSDSKENSFSSPVSSTPKNRDTRNVLEKSTSNLQNISAEENSTIQISVNKTKNKEKATSNLQNISTEEISTIQNSVNKTKNKTKKQTKTEISDTNAKINPIAEPQHNIQNKKKIKQVEKNKKLPNASLEPENESTSSKNDEIETTHLKLNTSTEKNNGWGGEWDEPLKDGEYEIFIPNKKYVEKRKSLGLPFPVSSFVQKSAEKITPVNKIKAGLKNRTSTPNSQKKVEFNLSANCSQDYKEYTLQVKSSKKQVPFDASKKPVQGLLKNSTPSPINPFYKKKLNFLKSP
uniref:Ribosomal RNA processing protein 1 homolog n=1 Tax=Cuerna arida TaxID=1464854 RepID=A0A1B6F737_9HEMI